MPKSAGGRAASFREARRWGKPTFVRSVRLPIATWKRLEAEAAAAKTSVNSLIAKRIG